MNHTFTTEEGVVTTAIETAHGDQSVVDGSYSNLFKEYNFSILADHNTQDFAHLKDSNVGSFGTFDGRRIVCTRKEFGLNKPGSWLQHEDGSKYTKLQSNSFLLTYTCSGNKDYKVWILEWGYYNMKENELRQKVIDTACSYLGCNEKDGSHKKIIDLYNSYKPRARGYSVTYTDPWCATFVSAVAIKCGLTAIMPTECGCEEMIKLYKKLGTWFENDSTIPEKGDVMFYDWDDSGSGDCTGVADHVGLVVGVQGSTITLIEGNVSDSVAYRTIKINGRYIRGFAKPNYASVSDPIDIGHPSEWAKESCEKAVKNDLIVGYGDGNFGWTDPITREQMAVILDRLGLL